MRIHLIVRESIIESVTSKLSRDIMRGDPRIFIP